MFARAVTKLFIIALISMGTFSAQASFYDEDVILKEIETEVGPLLSREDAPEIYKALEELFTPLARAQSKLLENRGIAMNKIYLIESPMINAMVLPGVEAGKRRSLNRVLITTGLIRHMIRIPESYIGSSDPKHQAFVKKEMGIGLSRIVGVLAHELGHVFDYMNEGDFGIKDHYSKSANQAVEIRADVDGSRIAEMAGFSPTSVLECLLRLHELSRSANIIDAAASTHPNGNVRIAAQKLYLTSKRYQEGKEYSSELVNLKDVSTKEFLRETSSDAATIKYWKMSVPKDLKDVFQRLDHFLDYSKSAGVMKSTLSGVHKLHVTLLIRYVDQQIRLDESGDKILSESDRKLINKDYRTALLATKGRVPSKYNISGVTRNKEIAGEIATFPSHIQSLRLLKFYKSKEHEAFIKKVIDDDSVTKPKEMGAINTFLTGALLSDAEFVRIYYYKISTMLETMYRTKSYSLIKKMMATMSIDSKFLVSKMFYNKVFKKMPLKEQLNYFYSAFSDYDKDKRSLLPIPILQPNVSDKRRANVFIYEAYYNYLKTRQVYELKRGETVSKEIVDFMDEINRYVYTNRKYFAAMELMASDFKINWPSIAASVKVDEKLLYQELRRSVKNDIKNYIYADNEENKENAIKLIADHFNKFHYKDSIKETLYSNSSSLSQFWINENMLNFLQANVDRFPAGQKTLMNKAIKVKLYNKNNDKFMRDYESAFKQLYKLEAYPEHLDPVEFHNKVTKYLISKKIHLKFKTEKGSLELLIVNTLQDIGADKEIVRDWTKKLFIDISYVKKLHELRHEKVKKHARNLKKKHGDTPTYERALVYQWDLPDKNSRLIVSSSFAWAVNEGNAPLVHEIVKNLISYKLIEKPSDVLRIKGAFASSTNYYSYMKIVSDMLVDEIRDAKKSNNEEWKIKFVKSYSMLLWPPHLSASNPSSNSFEIRKIKKEVFELATEVQLSIAEKYKIFLELSTSGPTIESDKFFKENLMEYLLEFKNLNRVEKILEKKTIHNRELVLELAKKVIEPEVKRLESFDRVEPIDVHNLVERMNVLAQGDSMGRDEFLEDIAWRLEMDVEYLHNFIEDEKSYNWKKANPALVNLSSTLSSAIYTLKTDVRYHFVSYVQNPDTEKDSLEYLTKYFEQQALAKLLKLKHDGVGVDQLPPAARSEAISQSVKAAHQLKSEIESFVYNSSPFERLPIYELLISSGPQAFVHSQDYPLDFVRKTLRYDADSNEEKMLLSFLNVIPEHERTLSMAYMLSQSGEDKSDIKEIFKVFQSVGVKFGQLASIWKIFDEEITEQIKELKDNAGAMTKLEVIKAAEDNLSVEDFSRIKKWKKILGSASMKTVALVELKDGSERAILVQNPNINPQIDLNLDLSERFIKEVERMGVQKQSALFDGLVQALKIQIKEETRMIEEAGKIKRAQEIYAELNKTMDLNGWKFEVPSVDHSFKYNDSVLLLELAQGQVINEIDRASQVEVGEIIAESSLEMLFKYGVFEPDRHKGNQLIDVNSKTIYPIDFGQMEDYGKKSSIKWDPRLTIARFIHAFDEKNAQTVVKMGLEMALDGKSDHVEKRALINDVDKFFKGPQDNLDMSDSIQEVIELFSVHGLKLEKAYMFGALKGLIVLFGEGYVSEQRFEKMLEVKIEKLYGEKLGALVFNDPKFVATQIRKKLFSSEKDSATSVIDYSAPKLTCGMIFQ